MRNPFADTPLTRVYQWQWIHAFTADAHLKDPRTVARDYLNTHLAGRLHPQDTRLEEIAGGAWRLMIHTPVLVAEWATPELAQHWADEQHLSDPLFVARGSDAERQLRDYGTTMLPERE